MSDDVAKAQEMLKTANIESLLERIDHPSFDLEAVQANVNQLMGEELAPTIQREMLKDFIMKYSEPIFDPEMSDKGLVLEDNVHSRVARSSNVTYSQSSAGVNRNFTVTATNPGNIILDALSGYHSRTRSGFNHKDTLIKKLLRLSILRGILDQNQQPSAPSDKDRLTRLLHLKKLRGIYENRQNQQPASDTTTSGPSDSGFIDLILLFVVISFLHSASDTADTSSAEGLATSIAMTLVMSFVLRKLLY